MVSTGIVDRIASDLRVILVVPEPYVSPLKSRVGSSVRVERLRIPTSKIRSDDVYRGQMGGWRGYCRDRIAEIAELTFGRHGQANESGILMRAQYLKKAGKLKYPRYLQSLLVWSIATLLCHSRQLRRLMQRAWRSLCPMRPHAALYEAEAPALVVTGSAGLGVDGLVMAEAAAFGCRTAVVVQSWDKTSTKGYPPVAPDHMLVWSHLMAEEAQHYLDLKPDQISVVGAPVWDKYFNCGIADVRDDVLRRSKLALDTETLVYVSIGYPAHHQGNLLLVDALLAALHAGRFPDKTGLLFRLHPAYFEFHAERCELLRTFDGYPKSEYWQLDIPAEGGSAYFLDDSDSRWLAHVLFQSDICVQASSTQLIEAAIFDCMIIDISFGRWRNKNFDIDISELDLTHLKRIHSANAANRVRSPEELIETISRLTRNTDDGRRSKRQALVSQELPVNRGTAALATAKKLVDLVGES